MYHTRIAPSPTGDMHLGTARTAYFNWLVARATGGRFILRIDDTDTARNNQSKVEDILQIMDWLGLDYDQLVYQSHRLDWYRDQAQILVEQGLAHYDDGCVKLCLTQKLPINWHWDDAITGSVPIIKSDLDYIRTMVLIKSDGYPTYNFASALDDIDLGINYVIRGTDHIKNTAKQVVLYKFYKQQIPFYAHVGLLTQDKKKLSKRDGAASMLAYRDAGYDPDAMLNFMLRLGWGPTVDDKTTAVLDRQRALDLFLNHGKMRASPSNIDLQKLISFDRKYKARR